ncbi:MAG: macro domain-containing protein [Acidimicrobiia bacterium]
MSETSAAEVEGTSVLVVQGDLTKQPVDAVVNAANEWLKHGGGVAAALVRAGGEAVQQESDAWVNEHGPVATGSAAVTSAGAMPARWIVHTVGPRYEEGQDNEGLLRAAVEAALNAAHETGASSVAFPAISAGIFGYPRAEATAVIASEIVAWVRFHRDALGEVRLVGFDEGTCEDFARGLQPFL